MPKILVADDNSNIQKMVALALKDQGIDVVAVGNGEAAVRKLPDLFPDLILADIFMPVRNGYEVCEFVKNDPRFAHVPVILLVGAFDPLDEQEAERVGADGVLKKPFVPPEPLINLVKATLEKSAAEHLVAVPVGVTSPAAGGLAPQPLSAASPSPFSIPAPLISSSAPVSEAAAPEIAPHEEEPIEDFGVAPARLTLRGDDNPVAFGEMMQTPAEEAETETPNTEPSRFRGAGFQVTRFLHDTGAPPEAEASETEEAAEQKGPAWGGGGSALPHRNDAALLRPVDWDAQETPAQASAAPPTAETDEEHAAPPSAFHGAKLEAVPFGKSPLPWTSLDETPAQEPPAADSVSAAPPVPKPSANQVTPASFATEYTAPGVNVEEIPASSHPIPGASTKPGGFAEREVAETEASHTPAEVLGAAPSAADEHRDYWQGAVEPPAATTESSAAQGSKPAVPAAEITSSARPPDAAPPPSSWSNYIGEVLGPEADTPAEAAPGASPPVAESSSAPSPYSAEPILELTSRGASEPTSAPAAPRSGPSSTPYVPEPPAALPETAPPSAAALERQTVVPASPPPASTSPSAPANASAVDSFALPQPADPALIAEVVSKVLERMQPQILDIVTKEILKPVVEALVRRELDKR